MIDCSVVVCTHNGADRLPDVLAALARQDADEQRWEVVVVDNASTDGTAAAARDAWDADRQAALRVVAEPRLGLSYARLAGIASAQGRIVSFVDDDNIVGEDWVSRVVAGFRDHPEAGAIGGRAIAAAAVEPPDWFDEAAAYLAIGAQGEPGDVTDTRGHLYGAGLSFRREALEDVLAQGELGLTGRAGGALTSGEDTELCYRIAAAGWRLRYDPGLVLRHVMPPQRFDRDYVRRLVAVSGRMEVLLEPLRLVRRERWRSELQRRWWLQAGRELLRLARLLLRRTTAPDAFGVELRSIAARARLRTLIELRGDFDRAVLRLRKAPPGSGILPPPG